MARKSSGWLDKFFLPDHRPEPFSRNNRFHSKKMPHPQQEAQYPSSSTDVNNPDPFLIQHQSLFEPDPPRSRFSPDQPFSPEVDLFSISDHLIIGGQKDPGAARPYFHKDGRQSFDTAWALGIVLSRGHGNYIRFPPANQF